jgi:hypothetical protein
MTTTAKTASNGSVTDGTRPVREHGLARVREEECYHLTGLVRNALAEAEHLTNEVNRATADRYADYSGSKGTKPLDRDCALKRLTEARDCAQVAVDYLYRATNALRDQNEEPPF